MQHSTRYINKKREKKKIRKETTQERKMQTVEKNA